VRTNLGIAATVGVACSSRHVAGAGAIKACARTAIQKLMEGPPSASGKQVTHDWSRSKHEQPGGTVSAVGLVGTCAQGIVSVLWHSAVVARPTSTHVRANMPHNTTSTVAAAVIGCVGRAGYSTLTVCEAAPGAGSRRAERLGLRLSQWDGTSGLQTWQGGLAHEWAVLLLGRSDPPTVLQKGNETHSLHFVAARGLVGGRGVPAGRLCHSRLRASCMAIKRFQRLRVRTGPNLCPETAHAVALLPGGVPLTVPKAPPNSEITALSTRRFPLGKRAHQHLRKSDLCRARGVHAALAASSGEVLAPVGTTAWLLEASPGADSRPAKCPSFYACGGCASQTSSRAKQLEGKQALLAEALGGRSEGRMAPIVSGEDDFHHRTRMDFSVSTGVWIPRDPPKELDSSEDMPVQARGDDSVVGVGLHPLNIGSVFHGKVLEPDTCPVQHPDADILLRALRASIQHWVPAQPRVTPHPKRRRPSEPLADTPENLGPCPTCGSVSDNPGSKCTESADERGGACRVLGQWHTRAGLTTRGTYDIASVTIRVELAAPRAPPRRVFDVVSGVTDALADASVRLLAVLRCSRPLVLIDQTQLRHVARDAMLLLDGQDVPPDGWTEAQWRHARTRVGCGRKVVVKGVVAAWQPSSLPSAVREQWSSTGESMWWGGDQLQLVGQGASTSLALWHMVPHSHTGLDWGGEPLLVETSPLGFSQGHLSNASLLFAEAARLLFALRTGRQHPMLHPGPSVPELEVPILPELPTCVELFSGAGALSLCLAPQCQRLVGVELLPEAVARAQKAAKLENLEFLQADLATDHGWERILGFGHPDLVVVNPPRKGLLPGTVSRVLTRLQPKAAIYVSCNPSTLASDVDEFHRVGGWRLVWVRGVDMFPHTPHVEAVALLLPPSPANDESSGGSY
jgi:hypothetical protein